MCHAQRFGVQTRSQAGSKHHNGGGLFSRSPRGSLQHSTPLARFHPPLCRPEMMVPKTQKYFLLHDTTGLTAKTPSPADPFFALSVVTSDQGSGHSVGGGGCSPKLTILGTGGHGPKRADRPEPASWFALSVAGHETESGRRIKAADQGAPIEKTRTLAESATLQGRDRAGGSSHYASIDAPLPGSHRSTWGSMP